jgi:hypothetical protein
LLSFVAFPSLLLLAIMLTASPSSSSAINIDVSKFVDEAQKRGGGDQTITSKDIADGNKKGKDGAKTNEEPTPEQKALAVETFFGKVSKVPTHTYNVRERLRHDPIAFTQARLCIPSPSSWLGGLASCA